MREVEAKLSSTMFISNDFKLAAQALIMSRPISLASIMTLNLSSGGKDERAFLERGMVYIRRSRKEGNREADNRDASIDSPRRYAILSPKRLVKSFSSTSDAEADNFMQ